MLRLHFARARSLFVIVGVGLCALPARAQSQSDAARSLDAGLRTVPADVAIGAATAPQSASTVIVGRVLGPDGAPAARAVVVTSAGGQAVSDAEGAFSLKVDLPLGAESVRVTAVMGSGTGSLVASAQVAGLTPWGTSSAGTLILQQAATCQPSWLPTFGGPPGTNAEVDAFTVFDDGHGLALYAAGVFIIAGGVAANLVAKWNGSVWSALGGGLGPFPGTAVLALTVFDDGSGPALYAGGTFTSADKGALMHIAKWNGSYWSEVGGFGANNGINGAVYALTVFDDGSGEALYAGGYFAATGSGVLANNIVKWNGSSWSALGNGMLGGNFPSVNALTIFDDGGGPALYAGGFFTTAGGVAANSIAKWNGSVWSPLGNGITGANSPTVYALTSFDDGSGPALFAGGRFGTAGGISAKRIAKWNGSSWSPLGSGLSGGGAPTVRALAVFDDGSGPALYAGGGFNLAGAVSVSDIAKWNGTEWAALGSGVTELGGTGVAALIVSDDGHGPGLHAGGNFISASGVVANNVATWNGATWSALGSGLSGQVYALAVFDDGTSSALYAGGDFTTAGGLAVNSIVKWNGASWSALGSGMSALVESLTVFDDGSGPALYAGGFFTTAGDVAANYIAKWDGASWSALGSGMNADVVALNVFDDGNGLALYAGGDFTTAGGVTANYAAKWNGSSWSALGSGMDGYVAALTVFDDGTRPALYAGGGFTTAGGVATNQIARWDGASWSALSTGMSGVVVALTVFDDGSRPALFAGGVFSSAGGVAANEIAKWNGASWSALGTGTNGPILALTVFDDGSGPALYAGGSFNFAGGVFANHIAKWNGASWSALGSGMNNYPIALTVLDDGNSPALYAGGFFTGVADSGDSYLAKWGCPPPPAMWTDLGFALPGMSGAPLLDGTGELTAGSAGTLTLSGAAPSAPSLLFISLSSTPSPFKCGTLVPVPVQANVVFVTSPIGNIPVGWTAWPAGLSGVRIYFQYGIKDAAAVCGTALSNALRADVP